MEDRSKNKEAGLSSLPTEKALFVARFDGRGHNRSFPLFIKASQIELQVPQILKE